MRCKKIVSYLNAYVDGELSEKRRYIVEAHLATCQSCRKQLTKIQELDKLFRNSLPVPSVPDELVAQIMFKARNKQPAADSYLLQLNPLAWLEKLSVRMRVAALIMMLMATVIGWSFDGRWLGNQIKVAQNSSFYGLEWFDPAPPGSVSSIYVAMTDYPYEGGK